MTRNRLLAAGAAVAMVGLVPAVTAPSAMADETCFFTDVSGDATQLFVNTMVYSEPSLDIVSGEVAWDGARDTAVFTIGLEALSEMPPVAANGDFFEFFFSVGGVNGFVTAERSILGGEEFGLGTVENNVVSTLAELQGQYDYAASEITIELPAVVQDAAGKTVFALSEGDLLTASSVQARRRIGEGLSLIVPADTATAPADCGVSAVGIEASDSGLPTLDAIGSLSFTGAYTAAAFDECGADGCFEQQIKIRIPDGATTLSVTLHDVEAPAEADLDIQLVVPGGFDHRTFEPGSGDRLDLPVDGLDDGTYLLGVRPHTAVATTFGVTIELL